MRLSNSTSGYIPQRIQSRVSKRYGYTHVLSSVIYNNQNVEVTQVPMDGRVDTQSVAYTNNEKKWPHAFPS